jgi:[histone H3]-lysine27 N-trimethyltransferase EZH2
MARRLAMGLSTVAGWGAFLHAPARKDQLLGEYTGELITQAEADRRCTSYVLDMMALCRQQPRLLSTA